MLDAFKQRQHTCWRRDRSIFVERIVNYNTCSSEHARRHQDGMLSSERIFSLSLVAHRFPITSIVARAATNGEASAPLVSDTSQRRPVSESTSAVIAHVSRLREAIKGNQFSTAVHAATDIKVLISTVVNTKQSGLKGLQQSVVASSCVEDLVALARHGEPIAYEALQILCYRNAVACEQVAGAGICESHACMMPHIYESMSL